MEVGRVFDHHQLCLADFDFQFGSAVLAVFKKPLPIGRIDPGARDNAGAQMRTGRLQVLDFERDLPSR